MSRRNIYILVIALFLPLIIWYAGTFSDMPEVTFQRAQAINDSIGETKKVLVPGRLAADRDVSAGDGGLTFFMQDEEGKIQRVVYDGSSKVTPEELKKTGANGGSVRVAGHMCSDGQGARFHAKNVYLSN